MKLSNGTLLIGAAVAAGLYLLSRTGKAAEVIAIMDARSTLWLNSDADLHTQQPGSPVLPLPVTPATFQDVLHFPALVWENYFR